jgi:NADH-quinone oxidoreductase subunit M
MFNDAFMGDVKDPANAEMPGLNRRELAALVLLSVPIVLIGIFPNLLFAAMQNSIADVVQNLSVLVAVGQ